MLDRYCARSFAASVLVSFCFVIALYLMVHFFSHVEKLDDAGEAFAANGIGLVQGIARYYAVNIPFILVKLGPFAILLAAMGTVQRMVRDQEIAAAQVAGVSLGRLMLPVLVVGLAVSLALSWMRQDLLPRLATESREMERFLRGKKEAALDGPFVLGDSAGNRISIQSYDPVARLARGVQIRTGDLATAVDVEAMRYDAGAQHWVETDADGTASDRVIETDLSPRAIEIDDRRLRHIAGSELDELAKKLPARTDLALMRQTRFTYPLTAVVLLLLGLPLVLRRERQSIYAAWGVCLLVSILYFGVENVVHGLAERDQVLSPELAAWIPVAVFGAGGLLSFGDLH